MKIYRVQKSDGTGPYRTGTLDLWLKASHNDYKHPGAQSDRKLRTFWINLPQSKKDTYKFAFSSIAQLNQWFNKSELKRLKALGFEIYELRVKKKDVIVGSRQVIYKG